MQKAIENIFRLLDEKDARSWLDKIERLSSISGANKLFKRIANASDCNQLDNYLVEVIFVLSFIGIGFDVVIEPYGSKGPDLKISMAGDSSVVEIMHFQRMNPGPPEVKTDDPFPTLSEYGNPSRDINKVFQKVLDKFKQIKDTDSIIAVWNSDGDLEDIEFRLAVEDIRNDATRGLIKVPDGLSFVIYCCSIRQPLLCLPIQQTLNDYQEIWKQRIESLFVSAFISQALYNWKV